MAVLNVSGMRSKKILLLWKLAPSLTLAIKSCAETLVKVDNNFAFLSKQVGQPGKVPKTKSYSGDFLQREWNKEEKFISGKCNFFICMPCNEYLYLLWRRSELFSVIHSRKHINRFFLKLQNPNPGECQVWQTLFTLS